MANSFLDELLKKLPQNQGNAFGPSAPTANPLAAPQAGIDAISQAPVVPQMTPELAAQREAARGGPGTDGGLGFGEVVGSAFTGVAEAAGSLFGTGIGSGPALPPTFTPPSAGATQAQAGTDIAPLTLESLGLESPQQRILQESAARGTIEDPFGVTQAQIEQAGNASFGRGVAQPSLVPSGSLGTVPFDPTSPAPQVSQENIAGAQGPLESSIQPPQAPVAQTAQGSATTVGGQPLSEFLSGGTPLGGRGLTGEAGRAAFDEASLQRDARQEQMLQSRAAARESQRGGEGGVDKPDFRALARAQGATGSAVNAQAKQLEADFDLARTSKAETPLDRATKIAGLEKTVQDTEIAASKEERARKADAAGLNLTPGELRIDTDAASDMNDWRMNGSSLAQSNMTQLSEVIGDLEDGNIDTRNISDFAPMSDHVRALFNPTGQDALDKVRGVIFQSLKATLGGQFAEKEGIRLVEAAYNPKLGAEQNIDRLGALLRRTQAAATAKDAAARYFHDKGTLKGFSGAGARAAFDASSGSQGAGGSPIRGDVNYQSDIQNKASDLLSAQ